MTTGFGPTSSSSRRPASGPITERERSRPGPRGDSCKGVVWMSDGARPAAYRLEGLTKIFPGVVAVDRVDLEVCEGEIHGIIGKNGAGKSALVGMIAGVIEPTEGTIWIGGEMASKGYTPARAHRLGVSLIPQEPQFARDLSVTDNLYMGRPAGGPAGLVAEGERRRHVAEIAERLSVRAKPLQKMGELRI